MKKLSLFALTSLLTACSTPPTLPLGLDPSSTINEQPYASSLLKGYQLTWSDEFNGDVIDEDKWHYRLDCKHWSQQKKENNTVSGGFYQIHLRKESVECPTNHWLQPGQQEGEVPARVVQYTGGGIITKKDFRYGYYEARLKTPKGAGWHTSFWMMKDLTVDADPSELQSNPLQNPDLKSQIELDPFENDSIDPRHYQTDAHQWKPEPGTEDPGRAQNKVGTKQIRFEDGTLLTDFHVYGLEFTETYLRYFFDGEMVSETEFSAKKYKHNDVNIWLTGLGTFLGNTTAIDDARLPEQIQVDYVRFFEKRN
jgi:beta-glucanase (GH16 family)